MAEWQVGQKVAKVPNYRERGISGPFAIAVVKGRKVVLTDGSEWATNGREWGGVGVYQHIATWDEERHPALQAEHHRKGEASEVVIAVRDARDRLTLEQIAAIRAVLDGMPR